MTRVSALGLPRADQRMRETRHLMWLDGRLGVQVRRSQAVLTGLQRGRSPQLPRKQPMRVGPEIIKGQMLLMGTFVGLRIYRCKSGFWDLHDGNPITEVGGWRATLMPLVSSSSLIGRAQVPVWRAARPGAHRAATPSSALHRRGR
jgi:hypothetical protein